MPKVGKKTKSGKRTGTLTIDLNKVRLTKGYEIVKRKPTTKKKK